MEAGTMRVVVIAGPNGAGKTTAAPSLLRDTAGIDTFVNADTIAKGLSGFDPSGAGLAAGRVMLGRLRELAAARASFGFETTLASRSFAPWISQLCKGGYQFQLMFLWLPDPELAVSRVRARVLSGGHDVPRDTIIRRYRRGLRNFHELYRPLATSWWFYDNALLDQRSLIACNVAGKEQVLDEILWEKSRCQAFEG